VNDLKLLVDFIEDKISPSDFWDTFYQDIDLQTSLEKETELVEHTSASSLYPQDCFPLKTVFPYV
jgi:hypothetical protein